jgi:nitroimidazol reductase NimA-like FMN-containing flavoprotein (pyridoxamine 5'-phosphate oxidase superfamily)
MSAEPEARPLDDVERSRRRAFVAEHRTAVFGYPRRDDGPSMSVVYYVMDGDDRIVVSTMRDRGKAKVVARNPKVSLCVLDEQWPLTYLLVYATIESIPT